MTPRELSSVLEGTGEQKGEWVLQRKEVISPTAILFFSNNRISN